MNGEDDLENTLSTLYHALRAARRRLVINIISDSSSDSLPTRELAKQIASVEQSLELHQATGEPYRNAYNALTQTHLPTLSKAGIIIYDPMRQTVREGEYFDLAELVLETNTPTVDLLVSHLTEDEQ